MKINLQNEQIAMNIVKNLKRKVFTINHYTVEVNSKKRGLFSLDKQIMRDIKI